MELDFGALENGNGKKATAVKPKASPPSSPSETKPTDTVKALTVIARLDFEKAKARLAPYKVEIEKMLQDVREFEITNAATAAQLVAIGGDAGKLLKTLETAKLADTKLYREHTSGVNGLTKTFTDPLEKIIVTVKQKNGDWTRRQILEERKKQKDQEEAAAKLQKELNKEAKEAGVEPVTVSAPAATEFKGITRSETGSSMHVKLVWKGIIEDIAKLPDKYCRKEFCAECPKLAKFIDQDVQAGVREIPGVKIEEVPDSRLRA